MGRRWTLLGVVVVLAALPACAGGRAKDVSITVDEFSISMHPKSTDSGRVKMFIDQVGTTAHNLVLVEQPAGGAPLPTFPTGAVDLAAVKVTDQVGPLEAGRFRATFPQVSKGNYILLCNLVRDGVSHYQSGMRLPIAVSQSIEDAPVT